MDVLGAHYSTVCSACGLEVLSAGPEVGGTPTARIGSATVTLPEHGRAPVVKHGAVHEVIFSGQEGNVFIAYEDGRVRPVLNPDGSQARHVTLWSVGFLTDGRAWWHSGFTNWTVEGEPLHGRMTPDGRVSNMGCLGSPERAENWMLGNPPPTYGGQRFFNPSYDGAWVVGQAAEDPHHWAYHVPTATLWNAGPTQGAPLAARVVLVQGAPVVCRNYPSGLIHQSAFVAADAAPSVPPPGPDAPSHPSTGVALAAYARKLLVAGFFEISNRYGDGPIVGHATTAVEDEGNKATILDELSRMAKAGKPLLIDACSQRIPDAYINPMWGWWVSAGTFETYRERMAKARELQKGRPARPWIIYIDRSEDRWGELDLPGDVIPAPQCYWKTGKDGNPSETLEQFEARMRTTLAWFKGRPVGLTLRMDGVPRWTDDVGFLYDRLIREYNVIILHNFSARRGPNGYQFNEAIGGWVRALFRAVPERLNRYDGWVGESIPVTLRNKLAQDVELFSLSRAERAYLLDRSELYK